MTNLRLLQIASVLGLVALGLMTWGTLEATVVPVMVSMTLGQLLGATSFVMYLIVIVRDVGVGHALRRDASNHER